MQIPAWHAEDVVKVLHRLYSDPLQGLSPEEVEKRRTRYGPNELKKERPASLFSLFLGQFRNLLIVILLVAIILSALVGEWVDALMIAIIVLISAVLGFTQEYKAERAMEALKKMLSPMTTVLRAGQEMDVLSSDLVPGDILLLEAGDKIPADARLIEVRSLNCDEAALTGESVPVRKDAAPLCSDIPPSDQKNMVFAGTTVTYGRGRAVVTSTGMQTEFGKIAEEVSVAVPKKTPLEKRTEEIGRWLGVMAGSICVFVVGVSALREILAGQFSAKFMLEAVIFAVALAIAAVPEALAAIVTGALAIGMHRMAKHNALVRKMPAVETLGCATVICSDKTGTLTKGEMTVRRIWTVGSDHEVTGVGYEPSGEIRGASKDILGESPLSRLLKGALLCNDAQLREAEGKWTVKGDPTEGALVVAAAKAGLNIAETRLRHPRVEEIPFSSERKRMTTIHDEPDGRRVAYLKGAPEEVLSRCRSYLGQNGVSPLSKAEKERILELNGMMAQDALRVLGLAMRFVEKEDVSHQESEEREMVFLGLVGMMDPPREEALEAVSLCNKIKIKTVLITGDHEVTARSVAREIGIFKEGDLVLTGEALAAMSENELEKIVDKVTVYARVSPIDKLKIIKAWKKRGEVVAMTGDGVNDAPALKQADIGIAMGITGTEVTKEAADIVLSDDNFATILKAIESGRWIYDNIKKYLTYLLRCNITEVAVIGGIVLIKGPDHIPLLAAAILYINLATDGLPALALGIAPPDPDIMERPPRNPRESVFSWDVKAFLLMALVVETPFLYFLFFHEFSRLEHARTEVFFMFIIIELVIALNFRSLKFSVFKVPPHRLLVLAIVWELALISVLVHIPSVRDSFGIHIPSLADLGIIFGFSLFVFLAMEALKALLRRRMAVPNIQGLPPQRKKEG
jgi:Ca2+-transporting ATPase